MRLAVLLSLCFFTSSVADSVLRVTLKLRCTLSRPSFSGRVYLMEWDGITDDDEITSEPFNPTTENPRNPMEHMIRLSGTDYELDAELEPYLKIVHNCAARGQVKEYRFELNKCKGWMALTWHCDYVVEAEVGRRQTNKITHFSTELNPQR